MTYDLKDFIGCVDGKLVEMKVYAGDTMQVTGENTVRWKTPEEVGLGARVRCGYCRCHQDASTVNCTQCGAPL